MSKPDTNWLKKIALTLVYTARRLRPYFHNHQVIVKTDCPIAKILRKPELAGRMVSWSIKLSEFGIKYEPRGSIKAQVLVDFVIQMPTTEADKEAWIVFVDGSSNKKGSGAGIVLEGPGIFHLEMALKFEFKTSNNQAEYEALIAGLILAKDTGAQNVECRSDSQLMVGHMKGEYQVKDPLLLRYYHEVLNIMENFITTEIIHIPREQNTKADSLSKLANQRRQPQHNSILQQTLHNPTIGVEECLITITKKDDWIQTYKEVIKNQE